MEEGKGDQYRSFMFGEGEKETHWRHGAAPNFDLVNQLFEQEKTKEWPQGSLEEIVQNAIKTWEMELSHKTRLSDFKSINPDKFTIAVNGRNPMTGAETLAVGSYNALLHTSLPKELQYYNPNDESFESSHEGFRAAMPRGFAWEVLEVYKGPPEIVFKFRHWGYFEGSYKEHEPTGEKVEFIGMIVLKVDEQLRAENVEVYYDPGEFMAGFLKGPIKKCPFME